MKVQDPGSETALVWQFLGLPNYQSGRSGAALMFNHLDSIKYPFSLHVALLGAIQEEDVIPRMEICVPAP